MMISIWRGDKELVKVPINKGCKAKKELMTEDYITIKFSSIENMFTEGSSDRFFKTGDYINDARFGWFVLTENYYPKKDKKTGGFMYDMTFHAYYYLWNNYLTKLDPVKYPELAFDYTRSLEDHAAIIVNNVNHLVSNGLNSPFTSFKVEISGIDNGSELKHISYDNIHIIDAISLIAETYECEWWIEDNVIYFGKCQHGITVFLKKGDAFNITYSDSSEEYGTRLYVFGSDKNLPTDYRKSNLQEGAIENYAVVQKRLMLPINTPYLEKSGVNANNVIELVKVFDVYPRVDLKVSAVIPYDVDVEDEDGNKIGTETRYCIQTNDFDNFDESYMLADDLKVKFSSGALSGMEFTVNFYKEKTIDKTTYQKVYEIAPNEDYGALLPNETMFPKAADEFHLLNWDSSKIVNSGLIEKAEQELLEAGEKFLNNLKENKTITFTMASEVAKKKYDGSGEVGGIKNLPQIGNQILLINNDYWFAGKTGRIISYEFNLDFPYDKPVYTIGEKPKYSRLKTLEENVEKIIYTGEVNKNLTSGGVYVISRNDMTPASDRNVYSSLRTQTDFLSKIREDTAKGRITFENGLTSKDVTVKEQISSENFTPGFFGSGFRLELENELAKLEIDELTVRKTMSVYELIIKKIRAVGGQIVVSAADGKIKEVTEDASYYRITFEDKNSFVAYDLIRCQTFSGNTQKYYWVEVSGSDEDGITVKKSEFNGVKPMPGDEVVLFGNTEIEERQNLITISATEKEKPRINILSGINKKNLDGCLHTCLGDLNGIHDSNLGELSGYGLYSDNVYLKGSFVLKTSDGDKELYEYISTSIALSISGVKTEFKSMLNAQGSLIASLKGDVQGFSAQIGTFDGQIKTIESSVEANKNTLTSVQTSLENVYIAEEVINNSFDNLEGHFGNLNVNVLSQGRFAGKNDKWVFQDGASVRQDKDGFYYVAMSVRGAMRQNESKWNFVPDPITEGDTIKDTGVTVSFKARTSVENTIVWAWVESIVNPSSVQIALTNLPSGSFIVSGTNWGTYKCEYEQGAVSVGDWVVINKVNNKLYNITKGTVKDVTLTASSSSPNFTASLSGDMLGVKKIKPLKDSDGEYIFQYVVFENTWHCTGTFTLIVQSGSADITDIFISSETTESYTSFFQQSKKITKAANAMYDENGNLINMSGFVIKPESAGLFSINGNGETATIGVYDGNKIKLRANDIILDGDISAYGNLTIGDFSLTDGGLKYEKANDTFAINKTGVHISSSYEYVGVGISSNHVDIWGDIGPNEGYRPVMSIERQRTQLSHDWGPALNIKSTGTESTYYGRIASTMEGALLVKGGIYNVGKPITITFEKQNILLPLWENNLFEIQSLRGNSTTLDGYVSIPKIDTLLKMFNKTNISPVYDIVFQFEVYAPNSSFPFAIIYEEQQENDILTNYNGNTEKIDNIKCIKLQGNTYVKLHVRFNSTYRTTRVVNYYKIEK